MLVGYGTWSHVDAIGPTAAARHIQIEWFGVAVAYQGRTDDRGQSVAGVVYASVEQAARAHPDSTEDMPLTLVCHVDNDRGRRFWESRGYRLIPDPLAQVEKDVYYRMVR